MSKVLLPTAAVPRRRRLRARDRARRVGVDAPLALRARGRARTGAAFFAGAALPVAFSGSPDLSTSS